MVPTFTTGAPVIGAMTLVAGLERVPEVVWQ
jgi:hypothetical protein